MTRSAGNGKSDFKNYWDTEDLETKMQYYPDKE